ncbi:MAG: hypothetical protein HQL23_00910 [Candidatus Omnitrophica bacterium]|nr:hypothetical protein [Candidatus Omnitrophota bacterium]
MNDAAQACVRKRFPRFGVNKQQEISRLVYEISRRENVGWQSVLPSADEKSPEIRYPALRQALLRRRYPNLTEEERQAAVLPALDIQPGNRAVFLGEQNRRQVIPRRFYVEAAVAKKNFAADLRRRFPDAEFTGITTYKEFHAGRKYCLAEYNRRLEDFFIVAEKYDFFCPCPCSPGCAPCGYHIFNAGRGCALECVYCFLPGYMNEPGIVIPGNLEEYFQRIDGYGQGLRFGSGQFTDSLVFDHITRFSPRIIDFFRGRPNDIFEFKTKSDAIELILAAPAGENIVISWSLNPQKIIETAEFFTAGLTARLDAAKRCAAAGYRVGFHFDPIIFYPEWERDYFAVVDRIFSSVPPRRVAWISLGCLRLTLKLKKAIENRFPDNTILNGEMTAGFDGKLRYPERVRRDIYKKMRERIAGHDPNVWVYLCMEP